MNKRKKVKTVRERLGFMRDGPGDGFQFQFPPGRTYHLYIMTADPVYAVAVYKITDINTVLGETVAIFSHYKKRVKHG